MELERRTANRSLNFRTKPARLFAWLMSVWRKYVVYF
jgi:hypothetical protein